MPLAFQEKKRAGPPLIRADPVKISRKEEQEARAIPIPDLSWDGYDKLINETKLLHLAYLNYVTAPDESVVLFLKKQQKEQKIRKENQIRQALLTSLVVVLKNLSAKKEEEERAPQEAVASEVQELALAEKPKEEKKEEPAQELSAEDPFVSFQGPLAEFKKNACSFPDLRKSFNAEMQLVQFTQNSKARTVGCVDALGGDSRRFKKAWTESDIHLALTREEKRELNLTIVEKGLPLENLKEEIKSNGRISWDMAKQLIISSINDEISINGGFYQSTKARAIDCLALFNIPNLEQLRAVIDENRFIAAVQNL